MTSISQISSEVSFTENLVINQNFEVEMGMNPVLTTVMVTTLLEQLGNVLGYIERNQIEPLQKAVWLNRDVVSNLQQQIIQDRESLQHLQNDSMQYKVVAQRLGRVVADIQSLLNQVNKEIAQHQGALTQLDRGLEDSKIFTQQLQEMIIANKKTLEYQQKQLSDQQAFQEILAKYGNNSEHITAFHSAIKQGDTHAVEVMMNHGVSVELQDGGYMPLHQAIQSHHLDTASLLIKYGANINARDQEGYAPLHRAIAANHLDSTSFLLQHGADAQAIVQKGIAEFRCLDLAREYGTPEMTLLFIDTNTMLFEEKVRQHLMEANIKKINPIELAFQKFDCKIAEYLLQARERDVFLKKPTFDFPGYDFRRPFGVHQGDHPIWQKPTPVKIKGGLTGTYIETLNRIDMEPIAILMKYDSKKLWHKLMPQWLSQSQHLGDLETFAFLYPLAQKANIPTAFPSGVRYLIDPFLSDTPINRDNSSHFYNDHGLSRRQAPPAPPLFEYRPDDSNRVRELKKQIHEMINSSTS